MPGQKAKKGRIRKIQEVNHMMVISLPREVFGPLKGEKFFMTVMTMTDGFDIKLRKVQEEIENG